MRLEIKPKRKHGEKKIFKVFIVIFLFVFLLFLMLLFITKTSNMIREVAKSELESIAFDIVGEVVECEISSGEGVSDIIKIERDSEGRVSSIASDAQKLNLLKLRISNELSKIMLERTDDTISIPIGSLTGFDLLAGRGPQVKIKLFWVSGVDSAFRSEFKEAGINQTNYRIMLDFFIEAGMMLAGREVGNKIGTSVCVAETVIVGEIPNFLYNK